MRMILAVSLVSGLGLGLCGSAWAGERERAWCAERFAGEAASVVRVCQITLTCQGLSEDRTEREMCARQLIEADAQQTQREAQESREIRAEQRAVVERQQQRQADREQAQAQVEAARQQALGLALFGSGPAMINGMNQGFQQMQVKPYVLPPAQNYQKR